MSVVRDIVMRFGYNPTAYQILNPGIEHWVMAGGAAAVGFVRCGSRWVVAGGPVCEGEALGEVVKAFEEKARDAGAKVCYICAAERMRKLAAASGKHAIITIGAQPVWRPSEWSALLEKNAGIRAQINRAKNKGVRIARWKETGGGRRAAMEKLLEAWLKSRPMPRMGFLTGAAALGAGVRDRMLFAATIDGALTAYLLASPIPARNGWLAEQIVRRPESPNGTVELLIDAAMQAMAERGSAYLSLGLVALTRHARSAMRENPRWVQLLLGWVRAHGRRFYRFDGLEAFRTKLSPAEWEPVYAISNERRFSVGSAYAMLEAFAEGRPVKLVAKALGQAVTREAKWMVGRVVK